MCGRYAATANPAELIETYDVELDATHEPTHSLLKTPQSPPPGQPDFNLTPTKLAPVVLTRFPRGSETSTGAQGPVGEPKPLRQLRLLSWGLVPSWAKDPAVGARMINARAESLLDKPSFAKAATHRRALVPMTGWYEWQVSPVATTQAGKPRKQPFFIRRADELPLALAGIYEFWKVPVTGDRPPATEPHDWLVSFSVITTVAEPGLDRIHDRQPVALESHAWDDWLDPGLTEPDAVRQLLADSHVPGRFTAWPVSTAVNSARNAGPELIQPLARDELVGVVDPGTGELIGE